MATLSESKESRIAGYDHDDPSLRTGDGGLTIWVLQKMAQEKRLNELNDLFDNGLTMNALPVGVCAGTCARVLHLNVAPLREWLDWFAEKNWRGKIYFSSNNKRVSEGRNRVRSNLVNPFSPFIPMCKFQTTLVDSHPLAPRQKPTIVVLNYSNPLPKPIHLQLLPQH